MRRRLFDSPARARRGMALAVVLVLGLLLIGMAGGLVMMARQQTINRARYETYKDEFAACEEALNKAYAQMQFLKDYHASDFEAQMAAITPPVVADYEFTRFTATKTQDGPFIITEGSLKGYSVKKLSYEIEVTARKHGHTADRLSHPGVTLRQTVEITYVPLYIFAIFYEKLMEIAPGAAMQVNGLVHTNGDAYFQSNSGLDFMAPVSVAGSVYHGRAPNSGQTGSSGDVRFSNSGDLVSMKRGNDADGWLTHADKDWAAAATERWGTGLADSSQGITDMSLPLPTTVDPHAIIERANAKDDQALKEEKFENKADLKIIVKSNGTIVGQNASGGSVPLTYKSGSTTYEIAKINTFYDAREGKTVNSLDIDISRLRASGVSPSNGILYAANEQSGNKYDAVRLVNGSTLPSSSAGGFTVATENPLYIKGDYNTSNNKLAMVAADALSILSNNWNDSKSSGAMSGRAATQTTVNCVCMQGIVKTANNHYSGGVENYFRLLEDWNGVQFKFSGSIINMWESEIATGIWNSSSYYNPPNRNWSWDTALGGLSGPPGAPSVIYMKRTNWESPEQ